MKKIYAILLAAAPLAATAQSTDGTAGKSNDFKFDLTGSVQTDLLIPQEDTRIGTGTYSNKVLGNAYMNLNLLSKYLSAGARFEYLDHPLPGFEKEFKGWGVPYMYVQGRYGAFSLTLGDYYEQFGSGLILRSYEERSLGVDNSLRGARLAVNPIDGLNIKLLAGQQRIYWHHRNLDNCNPWIYGGDIELSIDRWLKPLGESGTRLTLGFSAVNKHEKADDDITKIEVDENGNIVPYALKVPVDVTAFDVRANLQKGNYSFLAEYAWKSHDPSASNNYIYRHGQTLLLSGSYSKRGMSVLLQAKRSEDMAFRSKRGLNAASTAGYINHLPAFAMQHTYALAALYPYATQNALGEWAFQAELGYNFKRRTPLGGKYGTNVKVNFSHVRGIDRTDLFSAPASEGNNATASTQATDNLAQLNGTHGYSASFFKMGQEIYYQDINVQVEKKLTKDFKLNLMYMNQRYNKEVVEGHGGTVKSHIAVVEGKYRINKKLTLRGEAQYLHTEQDQKDWWYGLLELSVLPNFMFTISDQFNGHVPYFTPAGAEDESRGTHKEHYLLGSITYTHGAHRLQAAYGKTRAGYNCSGGVCRFVPASKGVTLNYSFNF